MAFLLLMEVYGYVFVVFSISGYNYPFITIKCQHRGILAKGKFFILVHTTVHTTISQKIVCGSPAATVFCLQAGTIDIMLLFAAIRMYQGIKSPAKGGTAVRRSMKVQVQRTHSQDAHGFNSPKTLFGGDQALKNMLWMACLWDGWIVNLCTTLLYGAGLGSLLTRTRTT